MSVSTFTQWASCKPNRTVINMLLLIFFVFDIWEFHTWILCLHHPLLSFSQFLQCFLPTQAQIHGLFLNFHCHICMQPAESIWYCHIYLELITWDSLSRCLSLEKIDSPSLNSHQLPVALRLLLGLCENVPTHIGTPADVIMRVLFRQPYRWDFLGDIPDNIQKIPALVFLLLQSLWLFFLNISWALSVGVALQIISWDQTPHGW